VPAQAGDGIAKGRELKISDPISRAVSVENAVGDAILTRAEATGREGGGVRRRRSGEDALHPFSAAARRSS